MPCPRRGCLLLLLLQACLFLSASTQEAPPDPDSTTIPPTPAPSSPPDEQPPVSVPEEAIPSPTAEPNAGAGSVEPEVPPVASPPAQDKEPLEESTQLPAQQQTLETPPEPALQTEPKVNPPPDVKEQEPTPTPSPTSTLPHPDPTRAPPKVASKSSKDTSNQNPSVAQNTISQVQGQVKKIGSKLDLLAQQGLKTAGVNTSAAALSPFISLSAMIVSVSLILAFLR